jgi:hypothetical protein
MLDYELLIYVKKLCSFFGIDLSQLIKGINQFDMQLCIF